MKGTRDTGADMVVQAVTTVKQMHSVFPVPTVLQERTWKCERQPLVEGVFLHLELFLTDRISEGQRGLSLIPCTFFIVNIAFL